MFRNAVFECFTSHMGFRSSVSLKQFSETMNQIEDSTRKLQLCHVPFYGIAQFVAFFRSYSFLMKYTGESSLALGFFVSLCPSEQME